jgi:5'-deoxynucleotidase YfbR-like HD superfamily hydrolase
MVNQSIAGALIEFGESLEKLRVPDPALSWKEGTLEVPETVADRAFRAMHIAYILAHRCLSSVPERAASLMLYPRLDLLAPSDGADRLAIEDILRQRLAPLGDAAEIVFHLRDELRHGDTLEARIAKDAHLLAEALSLLEQAARGRTKIEPRMRDIAGNLVTDEASAFLREASAVSPFRYWRGFSRTEPFSPGEVDYLYEIGKLRLQSRSGWEFLGIRHESVGAHSYRAAQLAPFLAQSYSEHYQAPADPCLTAMYLAVHDVPDARGGDPNRVSKAYVNVREDDAINHQTLRHGAAGRCIRDMWNAVESKRPHEGVPAKDGDYIEMAIEAGRLVQYGISAAREWIENTAPNLKTPLAIQIVETLLKEHPETEGE